MKHVVPRFAKQLKPVYLAVTVFPDLTLDTYFA